MVSKKKLATTVALSFGAAMTSMYSAPELTADIVTIGFTPNPVPFGNGSTVSMGTTGGNIGSFFQWNDGIGKTFIPQGIQSFGFFANSATITAGQSFAYNGSFLFSAANSQTGYIGFKSATGNVGWFHFDMGGTGSPVTFGGGAGSEYGNAGESLHVGGTVVIPEPAAVTGLALLSLGAIGLRRRRGI